MTQDSIFVHGRVINFHSLFLVYRGYLPWIKSYISVVRLIRYSMYGVYIQEYVFCNNAIKSDRRIKGSWINKPT